MNVMLTIVIIFGMIFLLCMVSEVCEVLKSKVPNSSLKEKIDIVQDIILNAVLETNQTLVDELKKNGQFDYNQKEKALTKTKQRVFSLLTDDLKEALSKVTSDINEYITTSIEAKVFENKSSLNIISNLGVLNDSDCLEIGDVSTPNTITITKDNNVTYTNSNISSINEK